MPEWLERLSNNESEAVAEDVIEDTEKYGEAKAHSNDENAVVFGLFSVWPDDFFGFTDGVFEIVFEGNCRIHIREA